MHENGKTRPDPNYPARTRRQHDIRGVPSKGQVWIAGKLAHDQEAGYTLEDASGSIGLNFENASKGGTGDGRNHTSLSPGDIIEVQGGKGPGSGFSVSRFRVLAPGKPFPRTGSWNRALWNLPRDLFERRRRLKEALRVFFLDRGFDEVETPVIVPAPGQEPHLDPFRTQLDDGESGKEMFLITSPEYFHKRLLAAGFEKIFEIARTFRNGPSETRGLHHHEFTMVEWYRAFASYEEIMVDMEELVYTLAIDVAFERAEQLKPPYARLSMKEAFERFAGVDLQPFLDNDPGFARDEASRNAFGLNPDDPLRTRYFKIFVGGVEPALGRGEPVFLIDFPASEASLSKISEHRSNVCERFELYIDGVELANGFTELNDPEEQKQRFAAETEERKAAGGLPVPQDPSFLDALELGMPPSGGVALGFDRLIMLLLGEKELSSVVPFFS